MPIRVRLYALGVTIVVACIGWHAAADAQGTPAAPISAADSQQAQTPSAPPGFWERRNLLGDLGGVRRALSDRGIYFGLNSTDEVLGNVTGGIRRGADY